MTESPSSMPRHSAAPSWLTPAFAWQVITFVIVQIVAAIVAFQFLASDVRSSREEQTRMREDIQKVLNEVSSIRRDIPNREALDTRLGVLADRIKAVEGGLQLVDTKMMTLREKLAENGWKP